MTSRKKPGVAFWATVTMVVVLAYMALFWPVCWLVGRGVFPYQLAGAIYYPVIWSIADKSSPIAARAQQTIPHGGFAFFGFQQMAGHFDLFRR
jgi:hypothetical protein